MKTPGMFVTIARAYALLFLISHLVPGTQGEGFLWPQPQTITWGNGSAIALSSNFSIVLPVPHPDLIKAAAFYQHLVLNERWMPVQVPVLNVHIDHTVSAEYILEEIVISVEDIEADLQHGVDESYELTVPEAGGVATLNSVTAWGAIHGLETFSQLVREAADVNTSLLVVEHGVIITDRPLYHHRGVMLDTGRNFYSVDSIRRTIRAMGHNKLNVFHWHITDSQSFPIELPTEPDLAVKGSYGRKFRYSQQDVKGIIELARSFGVRVVPEIDMPGHTTAFGGAYPEIVTCAGQGWNGFAAEPTPGQLNPLNNKTFEVVRNIINDLADLFPDGFYHGGADEINADCWKNSTAIQQYLADGHSLSDALTSFVSETKSMIEARNRTTVYWEDVLTGTTVPNISVLDTNTTILQTWLGNSNTKLTTSAGFRTIVSASDFFYLDCGHGQWMSNDPNFDQDFDDNSTNPYNYAPYDFAGTAGDWCAPFKTWQRIYDCDITANLTYEESQLVIGAEVALWSEQSDDTVVDAKLWPRSAAAAELLWSGNKEPGQEVSRVGEAVNRLNDWRFRLVGRGIKAEPMQPLWCLKIPANAIIKIRWHCMRAKGRNIGCIDLPFYIR